MTGLTDQAGGESPTLEGVIEQARRAWQTSMIRRLDELKGEIAERDASLVAERTGSQWKASRLSLHYWGKTVVINWPQLETHWEETDELLPTFDQAMLLYYLHTARGTPFANRWVGFRDLPEGGFYHISFQRYSGDKLAKAFGSQPELLRKAAERLGGWREGELGDFAFGFQPLPRIKLAAVLWPGDEDFPSQGSVLFDASAQDYLPIDGLALLGGGLAGRLVG